MTAQHERRGGAPRQPGRSPPLRQFPSAISACSRHGDEPVRRFRGPGAGRLSRHRGRAGHADPVLGGQKRRTAGRPRQDSPPSTSCVNEHDGGVPSSRRASPARPLLHFSLRVDSRPSAPQTARPGQSTGLAGEAGFRRRATRCRHAAGELVRAPRAARTRPVRSPAKQRQAARGPACPRSAPEPGDAQREAAAGCRSRSSPGSSSSVRAAA